MQPDARRFIDLATRPLEREPELRQAAEAELEKAIESSDTQQLAEAADALARADTRPHRRKWRIALYAVTLVVSLPLLVGMLRDMSRASKIAGLLFPISEAAPKPVSISGLSHKQNLLLYGDRNASDTAGRWKPLWESEPENPAYLAEYAAAYFRDHKKLSPEIRDAMERVDPDNGWFLALAAAEMMEGAVTREGLNDNAVLTIHDEEALKKSLATLHQLTGKPRYTNYQSAFHRERFPLFPARRDFVTQIPAIAHVASNPSSIIPFRKFADAWTAGAQQCAQNGDVAGFQRIVADWHAFVAITTKNNNTLVDLLVTKVIMMGPSSRFRDAAESLGLENETRYFQRLVDFHKADKQRRQNHRDENDDGLKRRNSLFGGLTHPMLARQVQSPPPLTDADMRPGRYTDHAFAGRVLSATALWLLGLAVGFIALARYRHEPIARRLSVRILDLLRPSDWLLLLLGGVVLPVLWYLFISRMTPLAAREWSITVLAFIPASGQFSSLVAALIILPAVIAGRLLEKRGTALHFHPRSSWPGWLAATSTLAAIPMFGAIPHDTPFSKGLLVCSLVLAGIANLWILGGVVFLCRKSRSLRRATLIRMIVPAWVAAMLMMALSIPFHYAEEQRWIQQDRLGEITADSPSAGGYEHLITQVLRHEILETLGSLP